jgi:hypothetical protein
MIRLTIWSSLLALPGLALAQDARFASRVVSSSGLGSGIYGNPNAVLGAPASWIRDTSSNGGPNQRVAVSPGYGAWNVDVNLNPVVTTVPAGGQITVEFHPPLRNHQANPYGLDFTVFGNAIFGCNAPLTHASNLAHVNILAGGDWLEPMQVSVSPDGLQWYTYPSSNTSTADALWPTLAFQWDRVGQTWGIPTDPCLPVNPALTRANFAGKSLADASEMYAGSAGGTSFDLALSGYASVRYVRVIGNGGELDAIARVRPRVVAAGNLAMP